ncbi:MAG: hypothetical protein V5A43_09610 [Haloarculaceae archaeon]
MSRRNLLIGGGAAAVLAAGGFLAYTQFLGGGGPGGAVKTYINAASNGNTDAVENAIHPDSPERDALLSSAGMAEDMNIGIKSTSVVEKSEAQATVEATIAVDSQESTSTFQVRKHEGAWKLWSAS